MPKRINLDKLGACASAVCAVHCLLTGVALGLLSAFGFGFLGSLIADVAFLFVALLVGSFALWHGLRKHGSLLPGFIFSAGLGLLLVGHFGFGHTHGNAFSVATAFTVLGGLCFVLFHVLNLRLGHAAACGCGTAQSASAEEDPVGHAQDGRVAATSGGGKI
jgi:hypothetical protein